MDIFEIIDSAHRALRGIDAGDFAIPERVQDEVSRAIEAIERGRTTLGYKLTEFDGEPGDECTRRVDAPCDVGL